MSRFDCPSSLLQLRALLKPTRLTVWAGLACAIGLHLSVAQLRGALREHNAAQPLTTRFVKRVVRGLAALVC